MTQKMIVPNRRNPTRQNEEHIPKRGVTSVAWKLYAYEKSDTDQKKVLRKQTPTPLNSFTTNGRIVSKSMERIYRREPLKYSWVLKTNSKFRHCKNRKDGRRCNGCC